MLEGGRIKTSNTVDTRVKTKVNPSQTKVNTAETKANNAETKFNTAETKVTTFPTLLLLLLTIFTARADATITYLKFSDQKSQPIDQAGTKSVLLLCCCLNSLQEHSNLQATNYASLDDTIVAKNLTQFTICASIYVGFFRKYIYIWIS